MRNLRHIPVATSTTVDCQINDKLQLLPVSERIIEGGNAQFHRRNTACLVARLKVNYKSSIVE